MAEIFEKLGLFYLGKVSDPASQSVTADYLFMIRRTSSPMPSASG
jgi:hypothetical protein